eukprot:s3154_g3.t1
MLSLLRLRAAHGIVAMNPDLEPKEARKWRTSHPPRRDVRLWLVIWETLIFGTGPHSPMDTGYPDQLVVAPPPTLKPSRPNHLKLGSPQRKANLQEGRTLRTSSIDNLSERLSERSSRSVSIPEAPLDSEPGHLDPSSDF